MKDNDKELLEILFKNHLKFFDNSIIIEFLNYYKNKIPLSNSELYPKINNDKYKISTELKEYHRKLDIHNYFFNEKCKISTELDKTFDSSYYLFNACKSGNKSTIEFLLENGGNVNIKTIDGTTPLFKKKKSVKMEI